MNVEPRERRDSCDQGKQVFHQFVPGEREVADKSEILKESPRFIDDWRNKKKKVFVGGVENGGWELNPGE